MKIEASSRLSATTILAKDRTWVKKVEQKQRGKPNNPGQDLPDGLFLEPASKIVQVLKSKSRDFQHAMSRLSFYINRAGNNLSVQDQRRLEQAKEALYRAYGRTIPTE